MKWLQRRFAQLIDRTVRELMAELDEQANTGIRLRAEVQDVVTKLTWYVNQDAAQQQRIAGLRQQVLRLRGHRPLTAADRAEIAEDAIFVRAGDL